jgi:glutamate racemase
MIKNISFLKSLKQDISLMKKAIGVFDSGVGGLTVTSRIINYLPRENIIYFGDTAHLPYGSKSKKTVTRFSLKITHFLIKHNIKLLVVACNTASALGLNTLRQKFSIPIVGVIKPGAKAAISATKNKKIGIIGTDATIKSDVYKKALQKFDPKIKVYNLSCPLFVPLVEEGWINNKITHLVATQYLKSLKNKAIDTLILGCTHYPLLKGVITRVMGKKVTLIDSAEETAKEVKYHIIQNNHKPQHKFFVSDAPLKFKCSGEKFLKRKIASVKKVEL